MPALASSSSGDPEVGISRTASIAMGGRTAMSANTSRTASPMPSGWWSSTVTKEPVAPAAAIGVRSGHRRRRVARTRRGGSTNRVDPQLLTQLQPPLMLNHGLAPFLSRTRGSKTPLAPVASRSSQVLPSPTDDPSRDSSRRPRCQLSMRQPDRVKIKVKAKGTPDLRTVFSSTARRVLVVQAGASRVAGDPCGDVQLASRSRLGSQRRARLFRDTSALPRGRAASEEPGVIVRAEERPALRMRRRSDEALAPTIACGVI